MACAVASVCRFCRCQGKDLRCRWQVSSHGVSLAPSGFVSSSPSLLVFACPNHEFFPLRDEGQMRLSGDKFCPSVQSRGTIWGQSYGKKVIKKKLTQRKSAIKILRISLSIKSFLCFVCRWRGFICRRLFSDAECHFPTQNDFEGVLNVYNVLIIR